MFVPLSPVSQGFERLHGWPDISVLEHLRNSAAVQPMTYSGKLVQFVPQSASPLEFSQQYEPRIYLSGEVQTRPNNWHDLFGSSSY